MPEASRPGRQSVPGIDESSRPKADHPVGRKQGHGAPRWLAPAGDTGWCASRVTRSARQRAISPASAPFSACWLSAAPWVSIMLIQRQVQFAGRSRPPARSTPAGWPQVPVERLTMAILNQHDAGHPPKRAGRGECGVVFALAGSVERHDIGGRQPQQFPHTGPGRRERCTDSQGRCVRQRVLGNSALTGNTASTSPRC